jgi:hypothetical protein
MGGGAVAGVDEFNLFIPITKIDEEKRLIYGRITEEAVDKSGEAMDYVTSKPYWEKWSEEIAKATDGKSVGNLRSMHASKVAGKLTQLVFDDAAKAIDCVANVLDDTDWRLCMAGAYTGFSQGGRYVKRWKDDSGIQKFTVNPSEVSLVDNPCLSTARFELLKADGSSEQREFSNAKVGETDTNTSTSTDTTANTEAAPVAAAGPTKADDYQIRKASGLRYVNTYLEKGIR